MSEELKPCPFCGGEAEIFEYKNKRFVPSIQYRGGCFECGQTVCLENTREDAIKAWNTRANEEQIANYERLIERKDDALRFYARASRIQVEYRSGGGKNYDVYEDNGKVAEKALAMKLEDV